jgi:hypothetical protein
LFASHHLKPPSVCSLAVIYDLSTLDTIIGMLTGHLFINYQIGIPKV